MKYRDLLVEYILRGNLDEQSRYTLGYIHNQKYLLLVSSEEADSKFYPFFEIDNEGKQRIIEFLREKLQGVEFQDDPIDTPLEQQVAQLEDTQGLVEIVKDHLVYAGEKEIPNEVSQYLRSVVLNRRNLAKDVLRNITSRYNRPAAKTLDDLENILERTVRVHVEPPSDYLAIDHKNKTISRIDRSKEVQSRMGGYSGSSMYILIKGDWSIDRRTFLKAAKQLKKLDSLSDYGIEQFNPDQSAEELEDTLDNFLQRRESQKITCYHGTSDTIWQQIKNAGGMKPGMGPDYSPKIKGHSENLIYLSLDPDTARRYAVRASKSNKNVILRIEVPYDSSKFVFDEDSLFLAWRQILASNKKRDKLVRRRILGDELEDDNSDDDANFAKIHKIESLIKPGIQNPDQLDVEQKKLLEYIKARALIAMAGKDHSFGYKGQIPLKNISVYETGKSKKYREPNKPKDPNQTQPEEYDEVESQSRRYSR